MVTCIMYNFIHVKFVSHLHTAKSNGKKYTKMLTMVIFGLWDYGFKIFFLFILFCIFFLLS